MNKKERKKLTSDFLRKLKDGANDNFQSEYSLNFANSTNHFVKKHYIYRKTIKKEIKKFNIKNYHYGPSKDRDGYPGHVWEFGFNFRNQVIYIKFRIHKKYIVCFKIHKSKKPIHYPFK